MLSFLVEEGIITIGTLSGIFTAAMLNSFRVNIYEPGIEGILPSHYLDVKIKQSFGGALENMMTMPTKPQEQNPAKIVKWQTFLRDFIAWLILMIILYLFWKFVIHKIKKV